MNPASFDSVLKTRKTLEHKEKWLFRRDLYLSRRKRASMYKIKNVRFLPDARPKHFSQPKLQILKNRRECFAP